MPVYIYVCVYAHAYRLMMKYFILVREYTSIYLSLPSGLLCATRMVPMFLIQSRNLTTAPRASPSGCVSSCLHANQQTRNWVSAVTDWGFHLESSIWQGSQIQSFRHTCQLFLFSPSKSFSITRRFDNVIWEIFSYHVPKQGELFFKISFF